MGTRRRIVAGNWKMNLDRAEAVALAEGVASEVNDFSAQWLKGSH